MGACAPHRRVLALAGLLTMVMLVLLGGCAIGESSDGNGNSTINIFGDDDDANDSGAQPGVIGGYGYTVLTGSVGQSGDDAPLSDTGSGGAAILFDDPVGDFTTDGTAVNFQVTLTLTEGGRVAAVAFGSERNFLTDGLAVALNRGPVFSYTFYVPANGKAAENGRFNRFNRFIANPDGTLYFNAEFLPIPNQGSSRNGPKMVIWPPDDDAPEACRGFKNLKFPKGWGTGDRVGLAFQGATITDVNLSDPIEDDDSCDEDDD